ncbi:MAG: DUF2271 domain-containing protein [Pedobacter sp.]|nr:MAG: DUF2271 domain-containing protein [Pedobacter sp.]
MKLIITFLTILSLTLSHQIKASEEPFPKPSKKADLYLAHYENVLGTALEMKFLAYQESDAKQAETAALSEIERLSKVFSAYDPSSEFNQWKNLGVNEELKVSGELYEMFRLFESWKLKTNGALNANIGLASKIWLESSKLNKLPSASILGRAVQSMENTAYKLNESAQSITKLREADLLMNSFAKSYIIQKATYKAKLAGNLENVIINIGGDLVVSGTESERIYLINPFDAAENAKPLTQIEVQNKAVATSGDYRRGVQIGSQWYSHIIDPRTANPVSAIVSATVIANDANTAGALATAFNILTLPEIESLKATHEDVEYLIVFKTGEIVKSKGWASYEINSADEINFKELSGAVDIKPNTVPHKFNAKDWDPRFELEISFNFNAISGNMRRPFVAIWVEDSNRKAVRNLALLYNKTKWVPDLRNWYRINGEAFKANKESYASVTGATKSPGKYVIKWDGKDNQGKYVPQGKYTVLIETSKEHGTDEFLKQSLDLKKTAHKVNNNGNVEISNVVFEFKKK